MDRAAEGSVPFTIILFTEPLAFEHARRKDYEFLIIPDSMGSNCEVDNKIVSALMAGTWKVKKVESPDYSEIKEIRVFRGQGPLP